MKSFYASVECPELELNPFETNLVVADTSRGENALCLAITPKMKSLIRMDFHLAFHDVSITATVTSVDFTFRYIKMGKEKMCFYDIYKIEILKMPNNKQKEVTQI